LVADGRSNSEVARKLGITEQTVKFHLSNIYRKLDVTNRTQASRRAQQLNILSVGTGAERS
jgi:DNA-binding CsgD family transcriptional regulator